MTENKRLPQSILLLERLWLNKFRCPRQTGEGRCINSATGTRAQVARVRAEYPNQLDYSDSGSRQHQKADRNSDSKSKMQLVVGRAPCSVSGRSWARVPQEAHASADYTAKHLPAFDPRMVSGKSGHPESNQGPSDLCKLYSQMLYQLSYSRLDTNHRIPSTHTEHAAWRANLLAGGR